MKQTILIFLISIFSANTCISISYAKDYDVDYVKNQYITTKLHDIKRKIYGVSSAKDQKTIQRITIDIPTTINPTIVRANTSNKKIEISTGYVIMLHQICRAYAIGYKYKKGKLGAQFTEYLANKWRGHNYGNNMLLPEDFAKITLSRNEIVPIEKMASGLETSILMFVVAHEIGHIVQNHNIDSTLSIKTQLKLSRRNEEEADNWAISCLNKEFTPIGGLYGFLFWYYLDQDAIRHEETRTHPAELRRMKHIATRSQESIKKWPKDFTLNGKNKYEIGFQVFKLAKALESEIKQN